MKKRILPILAIASFFTLIHSASATVCGPYLGVGAGYSILGTPSKNLFTPTNSGYERGGVGGRAFLGYNFAQYFGIEGGYARYARSKYTGSIGGLDSSIRYYGRSADIVGKFYVPLGTDRVNLYVLAGAVSFWEQIKYANAGVPTVSNFAPPATGTTNQRRTRPIYGGGLSFNIVRHFTMAAEYTYIQQLGHFNTTPLAVPNAQLATLNMIVNFG